MRKFVISLSMFFLSALLCIYAFSYMDFFRVRALGTDCFSSTVASIERFVNIADDSNFFSSRFQSLRGNLESLAYVDEVEALEGERTATVREKIVSRFEELSLQPDQNRLEEEMVYYIEKFDINEEKTRLRQHCRYFMETIDNEPYPGKKLGFIAQEMGREINTTGSKANHTGIQKIVVKMKDDLEKIKEQSLNIL